MLLHPPTSKNSVSVRSCGEHAGSFNYIVASYIKLTIPHKNGRLCSNAGQGAKKKKICVQELWMSSNSFTTVLLKHCYCWCLTVFYIQKRNWCKQQHAEMFCIFVNHDARKVFINRFSIKLARLYQTTRISPVMFHLISKHILVLHF